jgi:hypothetical protein
MEEALSVAETMHDCNEWYGLDWKLKAERYSPSR